MRFNGGLVNSGRARSDVGTEMSPDWRDDALCVRYAGEVDFFPARGEEGRFREVGMTVTR